MVKSPRSGGPGAQRARALFFIKTENIAKNKGLCYCLSCRKTAPFGAQTIYMLSKTKKTKVIADAKTHDTDTGSPEVQVSILSEKITSLTKHLQKNKKDAHSRRGLLQMVADRRKHLKYLEKKSAKRFNALIKKLGLK